MENTVLEQRVQAAIRANERALASLSELLHMPIDQAQQKLVEIQEKLRNTRIQITHAMVRQALEKRQRAHFREY